MRSLIAFRAPAQVFAFAVVSVLLASQSARATPYSWNSTAGGDWTESTKWTPGGVPGTIAGDTATLADLGSPGYTVNLTSPTTNPLAGLTINNNATLSNTTKLSVSGPFTLSSGGTYTQNAVGLTSTMGGTITVAGTVNVQAGTLAFIGDGTYGATTGTPQSTTVATGATLSFQGVYTLRNTTISGAGAVKINPAIMGIADGATATINNHVTMIDGSTLANDGGNTGGGGLGSTLNLNGGLDWSGNGTLGGAGIVNLAGTSTNASTWSQGDGGSKEIGTAFANFRSSGTVTFTATDPLTASAGKGITNLVGGEFNLAIDGNNLTGAGTFDNQAGAFFRKTTGSSVSSVTWNFTNNGTVEVQTGTLNLSGTLTNLSGGTLGGGTYRIGTGTATAATLLVNGTAPTTIGTGTTVEFNGPGTFFNFGSVVSSTPLASTLTQNNGTLRILGGRNFTSTSGSFTNSGTVELGSGGAFTGSMAVTSGVLLGTGTVSGSVGVASGFISPGTGSPNPTNGTLTVTGNVSMDSSSTLSVHFNGTTPGTGASFTGYDQLVVNGNVALTNPSLLRTINPNFHPSSTDLLFIVVNSGNGSTTGQFSGLGQGATFDFNGTPAFISYSGNFTGDSLTNSAIGGNDIVISFQPVPVPEPGSILLIAAGAGLLYRSRRRFLPGARSASDEPAPSVCA